MPLKLLQLMARVVGGLSGAAASALWMFAIWVPASGLAMSGINLAVALLMALMSLFVVIASVRGHSLVLLVVFVASFFPVGFYLIGVSHWLSAVGWLDLCYLLAGGMMWVGRRAEAGASASPMGRQED